MSFDSYSTSVNFEGLTLPLMQRYKYISRDKYGFVHAWIKRPVHNEFGAGDGSEYPLTLGHQKGEDLEPVIYQYRMKSEGAVTYPYGAVTYFKGYR